jgi:hypothetical protein
MQILVHMHCTRVELEREWRCEKQYRLRVNCLLKINHLNKIRNSSTTCRQILEYEIRSALIQLFHAQRQPEGHFDFNKPSTVTTAGRKLVYIELNFRFNFVLLACGHMGLMTHQLYGKNTMALAEL